MKRGAVEPPGLKWWQVLLDLAGSFSALGVGLYFSICERGETLDGSFLDQLSAEMAQKKKSQLPRAFRSKNKLFPLPQVWLVDFSQFGKNASVSSVLHDLEFVKANAVACWASLGVLFCNQLANEGFMFGQGKPTAPQRDLLRAVEMSVQRLMNDDTTVAWTEADIVDDFEHRTVTYSGEEICKAEPLTLARVLPGLPPEGHGGSVDTLKWVSGRTRTLLLRPDQCLVADVGQELPKLQGKVHIGEGEHKSIAVELVRRGICTWVDEEQVFRFRGKKVLSGLFGVPKPKRLPSGETVLRLIMNLVPANAVLKTIQGKVDKLPSITQWLNVVVDEGETLRIAQSDMQCAFYLFALPPCWCRMLCFNLCFRREELGLEVDGHRSSLVYLACRVLPMGWCSAVGVMQDLAETILLKGGFDPCAQISKSHPLPRWVLESSELGNKQGRPWWHVYLDNFAAGAKVRNEEPNELIALQKAAESLWMDAGVVVSEDKSVVAASSGIELGAFLGGKGQWIGASPERLIKVLKSVIWLCGQPKLSKKKVQIVMGRLCFILQFRRPGMAHFSHVWEWVSGKGFGRLAQDKVRKEMLTGICGSPLFHTWLGSKIDPMVTCSDASMKGGAVAFSDSLTPEGKGFVWSQARERQAQEVPVVIVSLFNGIGGAQRCYDVAGVRVAGVLACDIHKPANRVTARRWPHTRFWEDVRTLTGDCLREEMEHFGDFGELHLWAGFPCVDVSSVRAHRQNRQGASSSLIHEAIRVFDELAVLFPDTPTEFFVENVASMDVEVRDQLGSLLGVIPYRVCPSYQVPNSRPRFCWTSIQFPPCPGLTLVRRPGYVEVQVEGSWPRADQWLRPEWEQVDKLAVYPTFMKAIHRARPPPRPAGLSRADSWTRARWEDHGFRYPPYQYRSEYLVYSPAIDKTRMLDASEREILMGYGFGHTCMAMSASEAKSNKQKYEDERCSLVGDSFSIWSFVLFAAASVYKYTNLFNPQVLFSRMGLPPGSSLRLPLACPLQRGLAFPGTWTHAGVTELNRILGSKTRHTGSDIRVSTGQVLNPKTFPRQSVDSVWWAWQPAFKVRWNEAEHINALEIRAIYLSLLWKTMQRKFTNRRLFHLSDSYVAISILSKGRTGSHKLKFICRKIAALLLAGHGLLNLAHVDSADNPTDEASRS